MFLCTSYQISIIYLSYNKAAQHLAERLIQGGEGGIRTHGTSRYTRSPGARIRPDYATSPLLPGILAANLSGVGNYTRLAPKC